MKSLLYFILLVSASAFAQNGITWSDPVVVSEEVTGNNHPRIVLDGDNEPVVLWGYGDEVWFAKWGGTGFTDPVMISPPGMSVFTVSWAGPDLAAKGDTVYAVWKENPEDTAPIYVVHSYNGGETFSEPVIVDGMIGEDISRFPSITANNEGQPIVSFMKLDGDFLEPRYVVATSADFGNSFQMDVLASNFSGGEVCDCCPAGIIASEEYVINLYRDNLDNLRNSWAGISSDGGNSFTEGLQIDQTNWTVGVCPSSGPDGVMVGDSLYSVFMSSAEGASRVYFSRSSISEMTDGADERLKEDFDGLTIQNYPRIANDGNAVAVVWKQTANTASEIAMLFTPDISNGFPADYDTIAFLEFYGLENADIAVYQNTVHVVWQDNYNDVVMYRSGIYTAPVSIHSHLTDTEPVIYPHPATDYLQIELPSTTYDQLYFQLYDANGAIMAEQVLKPGEATIVNVSNLVNGVYFFRISDFNNEYYKSGICIIQ